MFGKLEIVFEPVVEFAVLTTPFHDDKPLANFDNVLADMSDIDFDIALNTSVSFA